MNHEFKSIANIGLSYQSPNGLVFKSDKCKNYLGEKYEFSI